MGRRQIKTLDVFRPVPKVKPRSASGKEVAQSTPVLQDL